MTTTEVLQKELQSVVRETLGVHDPRALFSRLRVAPEQIDFWCSDAETTRTVLPLLRRRARGLPVRAIELPDVAMRGRTAWITASLADVRSEPEHAAE